MSNGFTDFFETLFPREITVYVIPGSVVLGTILWRYDFYNRTVNCKLDSATYIFDKVISNPNAVTYTILTITWIIIAYTIGLIIGAIKEGILYELIRSYGKIGKRICDFFWQSILFIIVTTIETKKDPNQGEMEQKETGTNKKNKCQRIGEYLKSFRPDLLKLINDLTDNSKNDDEQHDNSRVAPMYISLHQKTMYRREIERYGVFANALENLAIALGFIIYLIQMTNQEDPVNKCLLPFIIILLLVLPIGAEGFRKLEKDRIKHLRKAMDIK